jgi:hypothetical protein
MVVAGYGGHEGRKGAGSQDHGGLHLRPGVPDFKRTSCPSVEPSGLRETYQYFTGIWKTERQKVG